MRAPAAGPGRAAAGRRRHGRGTRAARRRGIADKDARELHRGTRPPGCALHRARRSVTALGELRAPHSHRQRPRPQPRPTQPPEGVAARACAAHGLRMKLRVVRRTTAAAGAPMQVHPVLGRVYAARGVRSAQELDHSLERLLPVGTLEGLPAAVELLLAHRAGRILVIGDFDADGATSSALMVRALTRFGFAAVDFLVPNRFEFGYGLTPEIVVLAHTRSPSLIVTVDNGVSSNAGVAAARAAGIDVLVTDHHLPGSELPRANVIVNPNLPGSRFGSRNLAGVGVAFYCLVALRRRLEQSGSLPAQAMPVAHLLDLVALG